MPSWLVKISKERSVRRMMFIRQLGLKAYVDYPGAIHTRYSHVQGVMHLAGRVVDLLKEYQEKNGKVDIAQNLARNKANIMAAGFLHDIGHGPFSHVIDFVLKRISGKSHEDIGAELISSFDVLEKEGMSINSIKQIIKGKHDYPFISNIINGQLDVDKLDYLLRDAYHVGLKYSLDLNHFIKNFIILGVDKSPLTQCELGLKNSPQAIVTSEIFIVIWKSMYDLVYHVEDSRIAEKMLEKSLLLRCENDKNYSTNFTDSKKFIELDDEKLLDELRKGTDLSAQLANNIRDNQLYEKVGDYELDFKNFTFSDEFTSKLSGNSDELSDELSLSLAEKAKFKKYQVICDIVKSRTPKPIHIDKYNEAGEPIDLKSESEIIKAITTKFRLKIYLDSSLKKSLGKDLIPSWFKEITTNEHIVGLVINYLVESAFHAYTALLYHRGHL